MRYCKAGQSTQRFPDAVAKQYHVKAKTTQTAIHKGIHLSGLQRRKKSCSRSCICVTSPLCSLKTKLQGLNGTELRPPLAPLDYFLWHQSATIVSTYVKMNRAKRGNSPLFLSNVSSRFLGCFHTKKLNQLDQLEGWMQGAFSGRGGLGSFWTLEWFVCSEIICYSNRPANCNKWMNDMCCLATAAKDCVFIWIIWFCASMYYGVCTAECNRAFIALLFHSFIHNFSVCCVQYRCVHLTMRPFTSSLHQVNARLILLLSWSCLTMQSTTSLDEAVR